MTNRSACTIETCKLLQQPFQINCQHHKEKIQQYLRISIFINSKFVEGFLIYLFKANTYYYYQSKFYVLSNKYFVASINIYKIWIHEDQLIIDATT